MEGRWWLQQTFVAGTMFAARTAALRPLTKLDSAQMTYEREQGQRDGTLAHAIERLMAAVVLYTGYRIQELPAGEAPVPGFGYAHAACSKR